jgi:hypothetical protein
MPSGLILYGIPPDRRAEFFASEFLLSHTIAQSFGIMQGRFRNTKSIILDVQNYLLSSIESSMILGGDRGVGYIGEGTKRV